MLSLKQQHQSFIVAFSRKLVKKTSTFAEWQWYLQHYSNLSKEDVDRVCLEWFDNLRGYALNQSKFRLISFIHELNANPESTLINPMIMAYTARDLKHPCFQGHKAVIRHGAPVFWDFEADSAVYVGQQIEMDDEG